MRHRPLWLASAARRSLAVTLLAALLVTSLPLGRTGAQRSDIPTCILPPPEPAFIERVRRAIAAQPTPATPYPDGVSGEAHSMPYPPPPGEALDEDTTFALLLFLDQFAACASSGPLGPLLGVLTEAKWVREFGDFPDSLDDVLDLAATPVATSPPVVQRIELLEAWRLPDGRVIAVVKWIADPAEPGYPFDIDTLVLVREGGRWLIDDNWYGQGCRFVAPSDCPYGPSDGTPSA